MQVKISWSRIVCWIGALLDALVASMLTWPRWGSWFYGLDGADLSPQLVSVAGIGAALMWGWTALLLWASFKRSARRDVLIATVVPVMAGLMYNTWLDYEQRMLRGVLLTWVLMILQALIVILLLTGIWQTWREGREQAKPLPPPMTHQADATAPVEPVAQSSAQKDADNLST